MHAFRDFLPLNKIDPGCNKANLAFTAFWNLKLAKNEIHTRFKKFLSSQKTKQKKNEIIYFWSFLRLQKKWNPCFWSFLKLTKKINPWSWRFSSLQKHVFWAFKKSMFFELLEAGENWFHVFRVFFGCKKLNPCIYRFLKVIKSWIRVFELF